jgi:glycosyltransferase involved in cell wall biosynthesis
MPPAEGNRPLVSILTPSFNQGRFLPDCLASVERQTYAPVEHVVCDGGSSDQTVEVLQAAPASVRWVSEPDRGQAHALNKAFGLSTGLIVGWLNSDDAYADRRAVELAVAKLHERADAVGVFGQALLVNEDNRVLQLIWAPVMSVRLLRLAHYIFQPALFFRREILEREPYLVDEDIGYVVDRELLLRLARRGPLVRLPDVIAIDRHQHARKVESAGYVEEAARFDESIGIRPSGSRRFLAKAFRTALRLAGIPRFLILPRRIDAPIELRWPTALGRLRLQLFTPRRRMPFD